MRYYCTLFGQSGLPQGRALHQSLLDHAGEFTLFILTLDAATEDRLRKNPPARVSLLPLASLTAPHPPLAAAQADRTAQEFQLTCKPWLLRHLLPQIPAGELLTYLDHDLYFFSSPAPVFDEIGAAPVVITPHRFPPALAHLERNGRFNAGWVSLRHDTTGLACAADWADRCAAWCFNYPEPGRYAEQKYLDAWPVRFPGTVALAHPGVNTAPWNLAGATITAGPQINSQPLVCFHFAGLTHLGDQLYDPGLYPYDLTPAEALRTHVYLPYLRQLGGPGTAPDIVPPVRVDDPRSGAVVAQLLDRLRTAERERAAALLALENNHTAAQRLIADITADKIARDRYTQEVEQDRNAQRQALFDTRHRLEALHLDLVRNVAYIEKLHAEAAVLQKVSVDREAYIASLNEQLARRETGGTGPDLRDLHRALEPQTRGLHRVLVAQYHPNLLSSILWLAASGVSVEVLGSPPEYAAGSRGPVRFWQESLWDWLGGINSLFNEQAYLRANPDVAEAVAGGAVLSGWDHYQRYGQQEGRDSGTPHYRTGLADADAVAFDSSDAGPLIPCLFGRLQPNQKLFISSCFNPATVWLPPDAPRTIVFGDLLCCSRPPQTWIGPRLPSALPVPHRPPPLPAEIYPAAPTQQAVWPKISVVMICHNQAAHLEEAIHSLLDQQYPALEYLVIDVGSTDGSVEIIKKHSDRLAWWSHELAAGPAAEALNKGFAKSTGTIMTWLTGRDRLAPGSLFTVAQQFLLHDTDLVAGRGARADNRNSLALPLHRSVLALGRIQPLPLPELLDLDRCWLQGWFFQPPEVFFSRKIFERAGGSLREELRHAMDYDLWIRMARAGARILPLPEVLAISRAAPDRNQAEAEDSLLAELRAVNAGPQAPSCISA